jgi:hypothetical protein
VIDFKTITPTLVLKWASVVAVICLYVLIAVSIVLAMFGVYG